MFSKSSKIFIAGHNGLVGSAVHKLFLKKNFSKILIKDRSKLNLLNQKKVDAFFKKNRPEYLIICAARVGGIMENKTHPLEFLLDNLSIQKNLLLAVKKYNVKRTVFLGSSCIYPEKSKTPIKEIFLMSGKLEKTNEAYALSKIAGINLCQTLYKNFKKEIVCLMPTNVYGINDNFNIKSSHVIPGLISKFIKAKKSKSDVFIWGTGKPIREFIYVDDLAEAIYTVLKVPKDKLNKISNNELPIFNVGSGESITIKKLAILIKKIINFKGQLFFDKKFPDGTLNKNLDSSKMKKLQWKAKIKLKKGIEKVISSRV